MIGSALITGGAIRLGKALALTLANYGYNIALHYNSSEEQAEETAQEIKDLGVKCELFPFDFLKEDKPEKLLQNAKDKFADLNFLINSASLYEQATLQETTHETFDKQFWLNLRTPYFLTQAFVSACSKGNIVNILDNKIFFQQYHYSAYLLTKKALAELTKISALELAPHIRVNAIAPGFVLPLQQRTNDYIEWRVQNIPLKRKGELNDITKALEYIINNDFVNGQILAIDGGESLAHIGFNAGNYSKSCII